MYPLFQQVVLQGEGMARFAFTKLFVDSLETSATFYQRVFGMVITGRVSATMLGDPIDEVIFDTGSDAGLILVKRYGATPPQTDEVALGFMAASIHDLFARAVEAGGSVAQEPAVIPEAGGLTAGLLRDPEGHIIEVVESD